ncbi:unnamed protein product [Ranitomeya imitator]|uniref:Uncharacterized protein n=1 Tax=Ranitomeya imitator TaxID=111125 RepID=A0ABN9LAL0_9NEOB|nr:unnamed protein product [Ranitomeya imitator]
MFTLVTGDLGIVGRWRAVCVTALQRPNSDAAAIRIVVGIAAASLSVTRYRAHTEHGVSRAEQRWIPEKVAGIVGTLPSICSVLHLNLSAIISSLIGTLLGGAIGIVGGALTTVVGVVGVAGGVLGTVVGVVGNVVGAVGGILGGILGG